MRDVLFDGKHDVSAYEVLNKMNEYIERSQEGMRQHESNPSRAIKVAKQLRSELEREYKNNSLNRISEAYGDNLDFVRYRSAVHESIASIVGQTTRKNVYSFLYNVNSYMRHHLPRK